MNRQLRIRAGWLIDGSGGPLQKDVELTLASAARPWPPAGESRRSEAAESPSAAVIDWRHCTVLPGLVDAHVHLCWSGTLDPAVRRSQLNLSPQAAGPVIRRHLAEHWRHGVAAVRDGGDPLGHVPAFKAATAAEMAHCPQIKAAGPAIHRQGRYGRIIGRAVPSGRELAAAVARSTGPRDHLKLVNSGLNSLSAYGHRTAPQFTRESLARAVAAATARRLPVMVHANGEIPVGRAVQAGVTSIEHGFFMGRDNLVQMADKQVFWVPTLATMAAFAAHNPGREGEVAQRTLDHQLRQLARARKLGVPVALGTDAGGLGVAHGRSVAWELELLMAGGYPLTEAVRCGTANGARLLGSRHGGRIAAGAAADIIAVLGPPGDLPGSLAQIAGRISGANVQSIRDR